MAPPHIPARRPRALPRPRRRGACLADAGDVPLERAGARSRSSRIGILLLVLAAAGPWVESEDASAQEVDDPLSPAGRLRIGLAPSFLVADDRYGTRIENGERIEEVEPLGFDLSHDRLGSDEVPTLAPLESTLRTATGDPSLVLSLGRTRARIQASDVRLPLTIDLGVTRWLTVGVTVPFVEQRTEVGFEFTADPTTGDLGLSPGAAAGTPAGDFLQDVSDAVAEMEAQETASCSSDPSSSACLSARSARQDGETFLQALTTGYSAPLFPFDGSGAGGALRARLGTLDGRYSDQGVESMPPAGALPLAATPLSRSEFESLVEGSALGVSGDSLATWQSRWRLGDVEVHGAVRLLETGTSPGTPAPGSGGTQRWGIRSFLLGIGGLVRLGTGTVDDPDNFFDRGSGDGQTDVEGRVFGDVGIGRRFGLWADFRYGVQIEGETVRRIAPPDLIFVPESSRASVRWDPGDYVELEVAPRYRLTPELAVAARYRLFSKGRDAYSLGAGAGAGLPDPDVLEQETEADLHEAGISVVFSTLAAHREGRFGRPLEARVRYRRAVAGGGGLTPKASRIEVGVRVFWSLWGGA